MALFRLAAPAARCYSTATAHQHPKHSSHAEDILFSSHGNVHTVTLNRPKALNALNLSMIRKLYPKYLEWVKNKSTTTVIMKGAGGKAFCAGGDIRVIYDAVKTPNADRSVVRDFFKEEYQLNHLIGSLPFPHVAILDGITMGGGVGLSVHGAIRIATENTLFAMPETAIGLVPDVGGSFFLPRLQAKPKFARSFYQISPLGEYLALTGARLKGPEVYVAGIATHFVPAAKLPQLEAELQSVTSEDQVYAVCDKFQDQALLELCEFRSWQLTEVAPINAYFDSITSVFDWATLTKRSVEDRLRYLDMHREQKDWAKQTKDTLLKMSPRSLKVTQEMLFQGAGKKSLKECLEMEFRVVQHLMRKPDFFEGVRALLVDKDKNPRWSPAQLKELTEKEVEMCFDPLPANEELLLPSSYK